MSATKLNYDLAWKIAINEYFEDFLSFFLPSYHEDINWIQEPKYIDRTLTKWCELPGEEPESDNVYQLYKVEFFDREISPCLLHIQIQNQYDYDVDFECQMFICYTRAYDLQFKGVDIKTVSSNLSC